MLKRLLMVLPIVALLSGSLALATTGRASTNTTRCATTSLLVSGWGVGGGMGSVVDEFAFTNHSASSCWLHGYPYVQMLKKSGKDLSTTDQKAVGAFGIKDKTVLLLPGKSAYFGIIFHDQTGYGTLTCPTSNALKLTPPGDTKSLLLAHQHIAAYSGTTEHLVCGVLRITAVTATKFQ